MIARPARTPVFALLLCSIAVALCAPGKERALPAGATANVRIWKGVFGDGRRIGVEVRAPGSKTPAVNFSADGPAPTFAEYAAVPSGTASIVVNDGGKAGAPVPCNLAPGAFVTLLVEEKSGQGAVEIIDDAPAGANEAYAELIVRNFAPDLTEVRVHAGTVLDARLRAPGGFLQVRGLDRESLLIETTARTKSGNEVKWTTEAEFRDYRRATLLIFTDAYGRIRPRVVPSSVLSVGRNGARTEK